MGFVSFTTRLKPSKIDYLRMNIQHHLSPLEVTNFSILNLLPFVEWLLLS